MKVLLHTLSNVVFNALFIAAIFYSTHGPEGWSNAAAFAMWSVLTIEVIAMFTLSGDRGYMDKLAEKRFEQLETEFNVRLNQLIAAVTVPIAAAFAAYDGRFIFASLHVVANLILFVKLNEAYDRVTESPTRSS